MRLITISSKDIIGAIADLDLIIEHVVTITKKTSMLNRKILLNEVSLSNGDKLEITSDEVIAKIKLIMQADRYKDEMIINTHQIEIPFDQPEANTKPKPTGKKK